MQIVPNFDWQIIAYVSPWQIMNCTGFNCYASQAPGVKGLRQKYNDVFGFFSVLFTECTILLRSFIWMSQSIYLGRPIDNYATFKFQISLTLSEIFLRWIKYARAIVTLLLIPRSEKIRTEHPPTALSRSSARKDMYRYSKNIGCRAECKENQCQ